MFFFALIFLVHADIADFFRFAQKGFCYELRYRRIIRTVLLMFPETIALGFADCKKEG
jgi:hypothetical protein